MSHTLTKIQAAVLKRLDNNEVLCCDFGLGYHGRVNWQDNKDTYSYSDEKVALTTFRSLRSHKYIEQEIQYDVWKNEGPADMPLGYLGYHRTFVYYKLTDKGRDKLYG